MRNVSLPIKIVFAVMIVVAFVLLFLLIGTGNNELPGTPVAKPVAPMTVALPVDAPDIKNFHERKTAKMIMELRDKDNLPTYTYLYSEAGKPVFLCDSIGYGLSYSAQYTNPEKLIQPYAGGAVGRLRQTDSNGLYPSSSTDGMWIVCHAPGTMDPEPILIVGHVIVSSFRFEKVN